MVAVLVLGAAGALPALALVGKRPPAVLLAPLAGSVVAAAAAAACLALGGGLLGWFVVLALASAGVVGVVWRRRPSGGPGGGGPGGGRRRPGAGGVVGLAGFCVVVVAVAVCLVPLRAPGVGFDARTIWMLHAVWFAAGHRAALAALRNPALTFAHPSYPPLIGGAVGVSWLVTGDHTYRLGVVVVALLNGFAVASAAWVAVEVGLRVAGGGRRSATPPDVSQRGEPGASRDPAARPRRSPVPAVAGIVAAGALVLAAFGVAGPFATNGYADLLWAVSATGAIGYGLVLPMEARQVGAAALLLAVAGLTKDEGIPTAMAVVALMTLRALGTDPRRWGRLLGGHRVVPGRRLVLGVAGVSALGAWPVLVRLLGAAPDVANPGARQGDDLSRARATLVAMAPHLHVLLLAVPVAVVAALSAAAATRRRARLGNDGWAWAAAAAGTASIVGAYVLGGGDVAFWLATSVHRTTFFPALAAWWIIGLWGVVTAGVTAGAPAGAPARPAAVPGTPPEVPAEVDVERIPVLHQPS